MNSRPDRTFDVRFSDGALDDLDSIRDYIAAQGAPVTAERHAKRLMHAIRNLRLNPHVGRPIGDDMRELTTVPPHLIRYEVVEGVVVILRIRHGARRPD